MEYKIIGDVMQALQIQLRNGEEVYAEAGTMLYMGPGINLQAQMQGGLMKGLMRKFLAGEHESPDSHQHRRGSARNRIDRSQIPLAIRTNQDQAVADLQERREPNIRPTSPRRRRKHKGERQRHARRRDTHHHDRPEPIGAAAQQRIPSRMEERRPQNNTNNPRRHPGPAIISLFSSPQLLTGAQRRILSS